MSEARAGHSVDTGAGGVAPLVVEHLSKNYDADGRIVPVIGDLSLTLAEGEIVAVVGPSGCGKTTMLNTLCGLIAPDAGRISWERAMLIGYMRISTGDDRQSVDLQRDALIAAGIDERHLHQDKASGAKDDRPGLQRCVSFLRPGDCLVVWKLDRLGRSLVHLLTLVETLKAKGVGFRSLTEHIDTTTPQGELLFSIFGALAQFERALTRERVIAGLAAAKRRGRRGGRPRAIDDEKLQQIMTAMEAGASRASVCRSFGIARSTLSGALGRAGHPGVATSDGARP